MNYYLLNSIHFFKICFNITFTEKYGITHDLSQELRKEGIKMNKCYEISIVQTKVTIYER